jgi:hypothetical protein
MRTQVPTPPSLAVARRVPRVPGVRRGPRGPRSGGLLALAAALSIGCAAGGDRDGRAAAAIVHGAVDTEDPATVAIVGRRLHCGTGPITICSGTLIAPRVVLTAAHCFETLRAGDVRVFVGSDVESSARHFDVDLLERHPRYDPSTGAFDVALLRLTTAPAVTPVAIDATPIDASRVGTTVRLAGYGEDESMNSGVLRAGQARIDAVGDVDTSAPAAGATTFRYVPDPAMSCGGDSGGPVLVDEADGSGRALIGVTRSGDADCKTFGTAISAATIASDFVAPFVADLDRTPARAVFALDQSQCLAGCSSDDDCPLSMTCLSERSAGMHCGYPSLGSGTFAGACRVDGDCGAGSCVDLGDQGCRCYQPCSAPPTATVPRLDGPGGCGVASDPTRCGRAPFTVTAALALLAWTRRTLRRRSRCGRRSAVA